MHAHSSDTFTLDVEGQLFALTRAEAELLLDRAQTALNDLWFLEWERERRASPLRVVEQ